MDRASFAARINAYERLVRLDKPVGALLLLWPTLWAVWIASSGVPRYDVRVIFVAGTFLMRSAGCAFNDWADRNFDAHVERTRERPLARGEIHPAEALAVGAILALIAFGFVLYLNRLAIQLSLVALAVAVTYPFLKRFFFMPQLGLGIAFGFGIGGVKILNQPAAPGFRESVRVGEQNLYVRSKELVGDRDPRAHEFSIQMRPLDADKNGVGLGLPVLVALCGSLLGRNTRGGAIIVGALNLGGSIELLPNAVRIAELAVDKQAQTVLMPVSARRQLNELPDDLWTRVNIEFYKDAADAVFKSLVE